MCKSKMKTDATEPPPAVSSSGRRNSRSSLTPSAGRYNSFSSSSSAAAAGTNPHPLEVQRFRKAASTSSETALDYENYYTTGTGSSYITGSTSSVSTTSLRNSLPGNSYVVYDLSEISTATNNFLAKRIASSSSAWRCSLRGQDVMVFQRKSRRVMDTSQLHEWLSLICKSHHMSLIKLFGASISGGDHIYLVYDFVNGANLGDCLRNPRNPGFTVLSSWISRMQVAIDVAQGLEYIHHYIGHGGGHVHNHIKSSSLIITEPSFNAKICHFGTAQLCGEIITLQEQDEPELKRSDSRNMKFQGIKGYMSPDYQSGGIATQKSDVFAFGVVILELLSGEEPLKYIFNKETGEYRRVSVIQTAKQALDSDSNQLRLRTWIDTRLKDSFPVEVAEKMTRLALDCVHTHPDKRPDMRHVAGIMSKLYLKSRQWADQFKLPTEITVSLAPR